MAITRDDVAYTAQLARLELTEAELERFGRELAAITAYVEQIAEVHDAALETRLVLPLITESEAMRDDVTEPSLPRDVAVSGAPDPADGFFRVPKVIG
jgi:aspartyl-tRNA(Asn)/glutamyl-tRNA(Gln) amidotransferase subunit C